MMVLECRTLSLLEALLALSLADTILFFVKCSCRDDLGKEPCGKESGRKSWQWKEQDELSKDDEEPPPKLILKERNLWLTPTESCASDETEEEEEKLVRAPPGLADPVGEDVKRSDSRHELHGCQSGVTANAENHLQPRHKRKEDIRPRG